MNKCETCVFYLYDEDYDDYVCDMDLDEDEMSRFLSSDTGDCPFWRPGDDYLTARKQERKKDGVSRPFLLTCRFPMGVERHRPG